MDENECGSGDVGDSAGAESDVLQGAPALGEQGEPAFAEAAQGSQQGVAGAGVEVEFSAVAGLLHRGEDAFSGAFVSGVGQHGHRGGERADDVEHVGAGGGDVVNLAG